MTVISRVAHGPIWAETRIRRPETVSIINSLAEKCLLEGSVISVTM